LFDHIPIQGWRDPEGLLHEPTEEMRFREEGVQKGSLPRQRQERRFRGEKLQRGCLRGGHWQSPAIIWNVQINEN